MRKASEYQKFLFALFPAQIRHYLNCGLPDLLISIRPEVRKIALLFHLHAFVSSSLGAAKPVVDLGTLSDVRFGEARGARGQ